MNAINPTSLKRRSFIYRELVKLGAAFGEVNGAAVALNFGATREAELASARRLALADLSVLPHAGFKGRGTAEWLTAQGLSIGPDSNIAYGQAGGELAARLAPAEIFLLDSLAGSGALMQRLNSAWKWAEAAPRPQQGYPLPRQDSHGWFMLAGEFAPEMFSKMCGVDLRRDRFADGQIAQTSVAKMGAIIIRADRKVKYGRAHAAYHVLADIASAEYLWSCLLDAGEEFGIKPVGLTALRDLEQ
ncbi:MAG: sarcosine oxidase [Proteobacteria bacterium]|nr:sarcosine oxidase [Pseudomonadota bacterium]